MTENTQTPNNAPEKDIKHELLNNNPTETPSNGNNIKSEAYRKLDFYKNLAYEKHGSISRFGMAWGVGRSMGDQVLTGTYVPKRIETIKRIAQALGIDAVKLAQTFKEVEAENDVIKVQQQRKQEEVE